VAKLVLGDDHALFLDALCTVLSERGHVVAVARSTAEMVALVRCEQPDACLIGRHAARAHNVQVIGRLLAASERTRVVVLGADAATETAGRAVGAGASGYLHQSEGIDALISAVERVLRGEIVIALPDGARQRFDQPDQALGLATRLTARERQCLMMLVEGLDTTAITRRLGVSRTTVRTHLQSVLTKLGVHSRLEAVSFAVRHRLPELWPETSRPAVGPVRPLRPRPASPAAVEVTTGAAALTPDGIGTGALAGAEADEAAAVARRAATGLAAPAARSPARRAAMAGRQRRGRLGGMIVGIGAGCAAGRAAARS
jgi:two-component system, NarL family, nitrate/nitrite response regulator NarL